MATPVLCFLEPRQWPQPIRNLSKSQAMPEYGGTALVSQMIKHLPAMQETWVPSLGQEDPLEEEMATHSSILPGKFHGQRSLAD